MSRTIAFLKNTSSAALLQITTMFVGFFIPRIIISIYGSEINGLVSSITQFIAYFNLVEAGISSAAVWALYRPLAEHDYKTLSAIIVAAKNFYNKAGYIFISLTFGLAIIYPIFINVHLLTYLEVFLLVLILGASGALEFFTLAKYRVLLTADQKAYVISIASVCAIILNALIIVILAYLKFNIVFVRFIALLSVFLRSVILYTYVRKNYKFINYNQEPDENKLNKRWDAMFSQLLGVVQSGAPIILITIFSDLNMVSIYTVFHLVICGITAMLGIFINGLSASFGEIIIKNEINILRKIYNEFELGYYMLITVVYSVAFIMIMPFIRVYTKNIADISYDFPIIGFLMVLNGLLYNLKTPQGMMVISAGWYKETKVQTIIQALILVIVGSICGHYWGIFGILFGGILSNIYRNIDLAFFIPIYLLKINPRKTIIRMLFVLCVSILLYIPFYFFPINAENIFEWCLNALLILFYVIVVVVFITFFTEKKTLYEIVKRIYGVRNGK